MHSWSMAQATRGHLRDLPSKAGAVDPDDGFAMRYEAGRRAPRTLGTIARALEGAGGVILAADPDRERDAIAWQVLDWLEERDAIGDRRVKHAAFHEVTEAAVRAAVPFAARPIRPDGNDVGDSGLASERSARDAAGRNVGAEQRVGFTRNLRTPRGRNW